MASLCLSTTTTTTVATRRMGWATASTCSTSMNLQQQHPRIIIKISGGFLSNPNCQEKKKKNLHVVRMAPDEEKMTRRSPIDFPIEWEKPRPGRRPDILPQFSPMKTPLPPPLPADPFEEDEEGEEEKEEDEGGEGEENPEPEEPGNQ